MISTNAYAAPGRGQPLAPLRIERREPGPHDVLIDILYCGVCHSDIHFASGQIRGIPFPLVPGHEIIGRVARAGSAVVNHKEGDIVGVGCMVDSCRTCHDCTDGTEQFCRGLVGTYGSVDKGGKPTDGGYSSCITVDENFVLRIPSSLDPAAAAPLLCAGITTYSPLRRWGVGKGSKVGVVGLGGLGHMAVKFATAMGAAVTVFSTSDSKRSDALRLGAAEFAVTKDPETFPRLAETFDLIISTISTTADANAYLNLVKHSGTLVLLGVPEGPLSLNAFGLIMRSKSVAGSVIGGTRETQEMLDFCGEHGIVSDIEVIGMSQINEAYERVLRSDVRYRFVIDMGTMEQTTA